MKRNNFGKTTQEATRRAIAKELQLKSRQIVLLESNVVSGGKNSERAERTRVQRTLSFVVILKKIEIEYSCYLLIYDTERVHVFDFKVKDTKILN